MFTGIMLLQYHLRAAHRLDHIVNLMYEEKKLRIQLIKSGPPKPMWMLFQVLWSWEGMHAQYSKYFQRCKFRMPIQCVSEWMESFPVSMALWQLERRREMTVVSLEIDQDWVQDIRGKNDDWLFREIEQSLWDDSELERMSYSRYQGDNSFRCLHCIPVRKESELNEEDNSVQRVQRKTRYLPISLFSC